MLLRMKLVPFLALMLLVLAGCGIVGASPSTPTPTPTPQAEAGENMDELPVGPGAEVGQPYDFAFGYRLHCGVGEVTFDGRSWRAVDIPEEWMYTEPSGWTEADRKGQIKLVSEDIALFMSESGVEIQYVPLPEDSTATPCL